MFFGNKKDKVQSRTSKKNTPVRKNKAETDDYEEAEVKIGLDPDTKKGIITVAVFVLAVFSFLGLFDLSGTVGRYLSQTLNVCLGWGKWLFPLILAGVGFVLYNDGRYFVKKAAYWGFLLFLLSWQSLLHFFIDGSDWEVAAGEGRGGGYIGYFLASVFEKLFGFWGSLLILLAMFLVSIMIIMDKSLRVLIGGESYFAKIFGPFFWLKDKFINNGGSDEQGEEDDDEEENGAEDAAEAEEILATEEPAFKQKEVETAAAVSIGSLEKIKVQKVDNDKSLFVWDVNAAKIEVPMALLNGKIGKPTSGDIKSSSVIIKRTLENFGINVDMDEVSVGPTVTQYTFKPADGVKLSRITTLNNDLALALAAHPIRIEAPIPGRSLVGVEVPNQTKAIVGLREILSDKNFKNPESGLMLALGKDVSGKAWSYDLAKMPHLLVAGATNSGKSVCLNTIIISLLYQNNPNELRFIMVDPKRVEMPVYNGIPHLLTPVITDVSKTINALKWCLNEMDRRFEILSKVGKRNIQSYNKTAKKKMPYIIFVIDELADLMVVAARDIEACIIRLAQMARAVGIHLILATQRPSVDVITGLIKANMPARIAFSVASGVDSKTILDCLGAEKLLGKGDMLFLTAEISKPKRLQGAFLSDLEIKKVVDYIREKGGRESYVDGVTDNQRVSGMGGAGLDSSRGGDDMDDKFEEAKEIVISSGKASASYLQRRLSVGYSRAARLIDLLEDAGVIGAAKGAKPREVLVSKQEYEAMIDQGVSGVGLHNRATAQAPDNYFEEDEEIEEEEGEEELTPIFRKADEERASSFEEEDEKLDDVSVASDDQSDEQQDDGIEESEESAILEEQENNNEEEEGEESKNDGKTQKENDIFSKFFSK